ncbi:SEC-C metal-binding domain-containing protein [Kribbella sp. NPDC051936]|uniref:SEC-C metal-binding domain-containing protein n=1 Tax=Kribbella sp. NPDC051936 TaxID=3154946 RepID=UPI00342CCDA1
MAWRSVTHASANSTPSWVTGQPCWCGSGIKYKKCCGGPLPAEPVPAGPTLTG